MKKPGGNNENEADIDRRYILGCSQNFEPSNPESRKREVRFCPADKINGENVER